MMIHFRFLLTTLFLSFLFINTMYYQYRAMLLQQVLCCSWLSWILCLSTNDVVSAFFPLGQPVQFSRRHLMHTPSSTQLCASSDGSKDPVEEDLLSKAAKLRKEAQELEVKLRASSAPSDATRSSMSSSSSQALSPPVYKDLKDSVWTFSYRFATEPDNKDEESTNLVPKYGGKMTLLFRADGYTDLVKHEPAAANNKGLDIVKAWGWDLETSAEDEKDYLLFSIDVIEPVNGKKERCYFQARQEKDCISGAIELKQGTVTVKQDVTETKGGSPSFWGLFSPKGILARFMYCGDFVARPSRKAE